LSIQPREKQNPAVDDERCHVPAVRNHAEGEDRRGGDDDWRQEMDDLVARAGTTSSLINILIPSAIG